MSSRKRIHHYSESYTFVTDTGINYYCRFNEVTNLYAPILGAYDIKLIDFSFFPDEESPPADYITGNIVCDLIRENFRDNKYVMTYVCDESDGRQKLRQYKFQKWCERYLDDFTFQPINLKIDTDSDPIFRYVGILTHPEFSHEDALEYHLIRNIPGIVADKMG